MLSLFVLNPKLNFLAELLCKLYALILVVCRLECLFDFAVLIPVEYLIHLVCRHAWVLPQHKRGHFPLQIPHLLVNLV